MPKLVTLNDINLANKRVLLRVDYNVVDDGKIIDDFRIRASLPTIKYLLEQNCSVVIISHNGRPDGKRSEKLSLRPVAKVLPRMLHQDVSFVDDCVGEEALSEAEYLRAGDVMLLENLRFHKGEESNSKKFSKELAKLGEVYVDDAFGVMHRANASTVEVTKFLPSVAGLLVQKEYDTFKELMKNPKRPYTAVIGGAKISDKIDVLHELLKHVDAMLIGGAMANTFLASMGHNMQKSLVEKSSIDEAKKIIETVKKKNIRLVLPLDLVVAQSIKGNPKVELASKLSKNQIALDIGPDTAKIFEHIIKISKTIFWNGTLGMAEVEYFAKASEHIAHAMIASKAKTIVGGGDTAAFVDSKRLEEYFSFVSTGGGASLDMLSGKKLPGLEVLMK